MIIGLVVHPSRPEAADVAAKVVNELRDRQADVIALGPHTPEISGLPEASVDPDLIVSVGGDGTVLQAVQESFPSGAPVLGINVGQVGFLAEVDLGHIDEALDRVVAGDFAISNRMTLKATVAGEVLMHGLNDVVVAKRVSQRLATLAVSVDDEPFRTYRADGIVVATATGSTAYSFSAGGPALSPELEAMVMSAVAPHSLFSRSLVFKPDRKISIAPATDRPVGVEVDASDFGELEPAQSVDITRGDFVARFATLGTHRFPGILKHKLGLE